MSKDRKGNSLQYLSNNCILVINPQGKIRELFTPFLVIAIESIDGRKRTHIVENVFSGKNGALTYVINGKNYNYKHFIISISF